MPSRASAARRCACTTLPTYVVSKRLLARAELEVQLPARRQRGGREEPERDAAAVVLADDPRGADRAREHVVVLPVGAEHDLLRVDLGLRVVFQRVGRHVRPQLVGEDQVADRVVDHGCRARVDEGFAFPTPVAVDAAGDLYETPRPFNVDFLQDWFRRIVHGSGSVDDEVGLYGSEDGEKGGRICDVGFVVRRTGEAIAVTS